MSSADKFDIFMRICEALTTGMIVLNLFNVINISWWIVFSPVILVVILIMKEMGAFRS